MPDYAKLDDQQSFWTGPLAGQLYVKFLAFEGLGTDYTATNRPALSVSVESSPALKDWEFRPKSLIQVNEFLVFVPHRTCKVTVEWRDPVTHDELGTTVFDPTRMPVSQLLNTWFKIHDTARVLVYAFWGSLNPSQKFSVSPSELTSASFTVLLDRPQFVAGETVAGLLVYRPKKSRALRSVRLHASGYSCQISEGDFPDESRHTFFNHEAILLGDLTSSTVDIPGSFYVWTFAFPLPYAIPSSSLSSGNFYYIQAREVDAASGATAKHLKVPFGIRRVFYPRQLLGPAIPETPAPQPTSSAPTPAQQTPTAKPTAAPTTTTRIPSPSNPTTTEFTLTDLDASEMSTNQDELASVRSSAHLKKMMDEDSGDEAEHRKKKRSRRKTKKTAHDDDKPPKKKSRMKKSSSKRKIRLEDDDDDHDMPSKPTETAPKSRKRSQSNEKKRRGSTTSHGGSSEDDDDELDDRKSRGRSTSSEEDSDSDTSSSSSSSEDDSEEVGSKKKPRAEKSIRIEKARKRSASSEPAPPRKLTLSAPASSAAPSTLGPTKVAGTSDAPKPAPKQTAVRVPLRVRPGLRIQLQPSSGRKHIVIPVDISNTTTKPLEYFSISINYITVRTFTATSLLTGNYEYSTLSKFHVKRIKFKSEPGWPLQVGEKWKGNVRLALSEDLPPSVDGALSPLFSRTYYARIRASGKGMFTRQRVSQQIFFLLGDYDFNTRPLPIQHVYNTPIRFYVYTLPLAPYTPTFVQERGGSSAQAHAPTLIDIEQSEAIDLDTSMGNSFI